MNNISKNTFITGFLRSGTTLLEKLLHNHPDICVGAQPFPNLYYHLKNQFFIDRGIKARKYPLGALFLEESYSLEEFQNFLNGYNVSAKEVLHVFSQMKGYSGQLTQELLASPGDVTDGSFFEVYRLLTTRVAEILNKKGAEFHGAKEVFCEEFTPYFLDKGVKVVNVIRDPRDLLASVNFGQGGKYTGNLPILYILHKWRKSVAYSLNFRTHPMFATVLYEELANNTWDVLDKLTTFLHIRPLPRTTFQNGIRDQSGRPWLGNSSFDEYRFVSNQSIGKYKNILPDHVIRFIESVCYPEMKILSYSPLFCHERPHDTIIRSFTDPLFSMDSNNIAMFGLSEESLHFEIQRYKMLTTKIDDANAAKWYIFPDVFRQLSTAVTDNQ